ncbi:uncharacterized protein [Mytilus edulis]|uniref:uncharacterized protein n=1 Tax=Mytilus edulis TaxID=6550 RepID=UPI0039EE9D55
MYANVSYSTGTKYLKLKMDRTMISWFKFVIFYLLGLRCLCRGLLTLGPRNVPWENEQWTLECSLDSIVHTVSITNPARATVGSCYPPEPGSAATCDSATGYTLAVNETSKIVSMNLTIENSKNGTWTCLHSSESATYNLQSPLPSRHLADSLSSYEKHFMSWIPGSELTRDKVYNFSAHCGCMSATLKFVWTTVPGSSLEDISNTNSDSFTCKNKSSYMSTINTTFPILKALNSIETKLIVSVYVEGYYDLPSGAEYTYDFTFALSKSPGNDVGLRNKNLWNCFYLVFILGILF